MVEGLTPETGHLTGHPERWPLSSQVLWFAEILWNMTEVGYLRWWSAAGEVGWPSTLFCDEAAKVLHLRN